MKKLPLDATSCNYWNLHACMHGDDNGDHVLASCLLARRLIRMYIWVV